MTGISRGRVLIAAMMVALLAFIGYQAIAFEGKTPAKEDSPASVTSSDSVGDEVPADQLAQGSDVGPQPEQASSDSSTDDQPANGNQRRQNGNGVPEGFEDWYEPQRTMVDVYYGGRQITSTLAEYTLESIRFLSPAEVAESVPGLREPTALADFLDETMETHAGRVCVRPNQPLCGRLDPDYAGVIFDETRFRVDLFVHRDLLEDVPEHTQRYLPAAELDRVTAVQNLSALQVGSDSGDDRFSLFGRTRISYNNGFGFADWVSTEDRGLSIDQLGYRHDLLDHQVTAGLFEPSFDMLRALPRQPMLGVGMSRSLERRTDLDSVIASPVELFLPLRARVDILRDGRLVSSAFYEAGNQRIDTERLPAGVYNVELVITDVNGQVRTENQLFVKSALLAPPGEPLWFVEAGRVMRRAPLETFPDELDATLMRAGFRWRQYEWLGLGVAGAATEDAALGELSANAFFDWLEVGTEVFNSSAGGWGWGLRGVARWRNTAMSLNAQRVRRDDLDDETLLDPDAFFLLPRHQTLRSVQLNQRLSRRDQVSVSASERRDITGELTRRSNARYTHTRFLGAGQSISLGSEVGEVDGDGRVQLFVQWRASRNNWGHSARLQWNDSDVPGGQDGVSATVSSRWRDGERFNDDIDAGVSAQFEDQRSSITLDGQHRSQYGRGRVAVTASDNEGERSNQYLAGYDTSVAMGESYRPAVGGQGFGDAAMILDLRDAKGGKLDVYVDGRRQFTARGGRRAVVTLNGYQEHHVTLADRGMELINFDTDPRRQVLYPGNVAELSWEMSRVNVLVGRLYRLEELCSEVTAECHTLRLPLADARVEGVEGVTFTDPDGFFQADVRTDVTELTATRRGRSCRVDISEVPVSNGVMRASELICDLTEQPVDEQEVLVPGASADNIETETETETETE